MNEKDLYFQPENYGKKENKEPKKKSEKKDHRILKLLGFLLFLLIIILIILWLLRGRTTVSGQFPMNVRNESLTCVSNDLIPPKLAGADSKEKEVKINAVFNGTEELKSISLIYTLNYSSSDEAYGYEAKSHADFNKALGASGFEVNKFRNKFARYDSKLIISLFGNKSDINQIAAPYFMITVDEDGNVPVTLKDYQVNYESQGFACESTTEQ